MHRLGWMGGLEGNEKGVGKGLGKGGGAKFLGMEANKQKINRK